MTQQRLRYLLTDSRWVWGLRSLPSLSRARALFLCRTSTMATFERCRALWDVCETVLTGNVPGALVECGVWKGGSAAIMGLAARNFRSERLLHLFDSFAGLPEPGPEDGDSAADYSGGKAGGQLKSISLCEAGLEAVKSFLLEQLGFDPGAVHFHQGWFQDTVPLAANRIGPISVLRLDGDWYASTWVCLEHLYPLISPGGVVIVDDYHAWEGCHKATDQYRQKHEISAPLVMADSTCCFWVKNSESIRKG